MPFNKQNSLSWSTGSVVGRGGPGVASDGSKGGNSLDAVALAGFTAKRCGLDAGSGDSLEMIVFCISIHHLWGRTLAKYQQHACAIAYADDGYIKAKLSVVLKVLSDIQQVFKEDAGLELQLDKTAFLVKGISAEDALHAADTIVKADPSSRTLPPTCFIFSVSLRRGMRGSVFPSALTRLFRIL